MQDADRMLGELTGKPQPVGNGGAIQKVRYSHEAMIDLIIAKPWISQNELAAHFEYTAPWVSRIIASDAFQARLAERTKELVDPTVRATVEERFKALVLRSLEILEEKLAKPSHQIPDQLALRTFELSARAAGYGAKDSQPSVATTEVHVHLEQISNGLTQLLRRKKVEVTEAELVPQS